jgi:NAD(P)-dependent dehydrogenase (short-subunit alcohol dehydrogenase family)
MSLKGKVAIVTGGGSGIGRAVCGLLAKEGSTVAVVDVVADTAVATSMEIKEAGGRTLHGTFDVSDGSGVESFVKQVLREYQRVDILVNNAGGVISFDNVLDCTESDWDRTFSKNLKGVFLMSRAVLPSMIENRTGSIVNISSAAALVGMKKLAAYSAAKGAIIALTRAMAHDYGEFGIRVNCVCPGATMTPLFLKHHPTQAIRTARVGEYPLGRLGEPLDIAEAVTFLASDRASWITGIVMPVDGGNTAR